MAYHQGGHLQAAAQHYQTVLQSAPRDFYALRLLGIVRLQQGNFQEAEKLLSKAVKQNGNSGDTYYYLGRAFWENRNKERAIFCLKRCIALEPRHDTALVMLGFAYVDAGKRAQALEFFRGAAAVNPGAADAWYNIAKLLDATEQSEEVLNCYDSAIAARPNFWEAWNAKGVLLWTLKRHQDALASFDQALAIKPDFVEAAVNKASALSDIDKWAEALALYDSALKLRPNHPETLLWRGNALFALKQYEQALASFRQALSLRPQYVEALTNIANALNQLGRCHEAAAACDRALAIDPNFAAALNGRGFACLELGRFEESLASYDRALQINPNFAEAYFNRGIVLRDGFNRMREAIDSFHNAVAAKPGYAEARFAACDTEIPIIYSSEPEVLERRQAYREHLAQLAEEIAASKSYCSWASGVGVRHPFFLAYQGLNDRDLAEVYGSLVCKIMAERFPPVPLASPPRPEEPIRVGFVSGFFRWHSVWKIPTKGWLAQLDRRRFRLFGYHTSVKTDSATAEAASLCERFVQGPFSIDQWRNIIASDAPHVLIYPEIGMDPACAALAALRLAPAQCLSLGHPDTTGYHTMDFYLSSDLMEPPNAQEHYTEKLVRLPNLSVYYEHPVIGEAADQDQADRDLPAGPLLYWCGQSLFKYLPQFDQVFPRIAREVEDCRFVFIQNVFGIPLTDVFRDRLKAAFAAFEFDWEDYCIILPRLSPSEFVGAIGRCHIILDSIQWSGFNSSMESLFHALPIVTVPGPLMRSCHTTAILRMMGVTDTVCDDLDGYVRTAVRLAHDQDWRRLIATVMAAKKQQVYRDRACIEGLEDFLQRAAGFDHT